MARWIRRAHGDMPLAEFKALVREQFNILLIDQDAALAAIPAMLPDDTEARREAIGLIEQVLGARGAPSDEDRERLDEIAHLFTGKKKESASMHSIGKVRAERRAVK
jgi:hypothetical protein